MNRELQRGQHQAALIRLEAKFARAIKKALRAALAEVRARLEAGIVAGGFVDGFALLAAASGQGEAMTSIDDVAVVATIFPKLVDRDLLPLVEHAYQTGGMRALKEFPGAAAAIGTMSSEQVAAMTRAGAAQLEEARGRLIGIGDAAWLSVRDELLAGYKDGESIDKLAARVTAVSDLIGYKAEAIARTEITSAVNAGSLDSMRALGDAAPTTKTWLATMDARTRDSHAEADGQTVGIDELFIVGGWECDYPGDETLPDEEVINCRCTMVWDQKPTEEGAEAVDQADIAAVAEEDRAYTADALAQLTDRWEAEGLEVEAYVNSSGAITLSKVVVPEGLRDAGVGSRFMQDLIDLADVHGVRVDLSPSDAFGGDVGRLREFYKEFGFIENKGRGREFESSESMYRLPVDASVLSPAEVAKAMESGGPIVYADTPEEAITALLAGHRVELDEVHDVSVLLDELAAMGEEAKAKGEKAPNFDLCDVTVAGSSLFCTENLGIPRLGMPQLSGVPLPGSKAAALEPDSRGEVFINDQFRQHLIDMGVKIEDRDALAGYLKGTQNELNGAKVAGIMHAIENGTYAESRLFVSRDNYIVDGHHRWAAQVAVDIRDSHMGDIRMPVQSIDMPILDLLVEANRFASEWGIPQANAGAASEAGLQQGAPGKAQGGSYETLLDEVGFGRAFSAMSDADLEPANDALNQWQRDEGSGALGDYLRHGVLSSGGHDDRADLMANREWMDEQVSAIRSVMVPSEHNATAYRGMALAREPRVGQVLIDRGFVSVTDDIDAAAEFAKGRADGTGEYAGLMTRGGSGTLPYAFEIKVPQGTRGVTVEPGFETLLDGARMHIDRVSWRDDLGHYIVEAHLV